MNRKQRRRLEAAHRNQPRNASTPVDVWLSDFRLAAHDLLKSYVGKPRSAKDELLAKLAELSLLHQQRVSRLVLSADAQRAVDIVTALERSCNALKAQIDHHVESPSA